MCWSLAIIAIDLIKQDIRPAAPEAMVMVNIIFEHQPLQMPTVEAIY